MTVVREKEEGTSRPGSRRTKRSDHELVLVVDDEPQVLQLLKRVLDRAGFETVAISDGRAAHQAAVEWRPDIILLDLMLGAVTGDEVIKNLGSIILEVLEENYSGEHFAGHVGGDDFVILTEPRLAEEVASEITRRFDEAVPALYDKADRERGWVEFEDRTGNKHRTGLISLSTGIVIAKPGAFSSAPALAARAAEVKGVAKRIPGSKWVVDRRRPPEARHR